MRIAIVTESFLPTVNGVSGTVAHVTRQLAQRGHHVLVLAPRPRPGRTPAAWPDPPPTAGSVTVVRTAAVPLPGYPELPVGYPTPACAAALAAHQPDLVHLAGPVALGAWGVAAARRLDVPAIAVYQTDFPAFARHYHAGMAQGLAWRWLRRLHAHADRTLAPSSAAMWDLRRHGIPRVHRWGRGVDLDRFHPRHRDPGLRDRLAAGARLLVGYVGRLAPEKDVGLLRALHDLPDVRVVVVGDGPDRAALQRRLGFATFLGHRTGADLARILASCDAFVHTGVHETFCQTVQEALASGVPVVAPAAGGPLDLVRPGDNGLLYPPGDAPALRRAVAALATDDELLNGLAAGARPSVAGRSWAHLTDQLLGHYELVRRGQRTVDAA